MINLDPSETPQNPTWHPKSTQIEPWTGPETSPWRDLDPDPSDSLTDIMPLWSAVSSDFPLIMTSDPTGIISYSQSSQDQKVPQ